MSELFPAAAPQVSIDVQIAEVQRELRQREFVYARSIQRGTMKQEDASRYIARMKAVLATLERVKLHGLVPCPPQPGSVGP
jgi:hypothetical protein